MKLNAHYMMAVILMQSRIYLNNGLHDHYRVYAPPKGSFTRISFHITNVYDLQYEPFSVPVQLPINYTSWIFNNYQDSYIKSLFVVVYITLCCAPFFWSRFL